MTPSTPNGVRAKDAAPLRAGPVGERPRARGIGLGVVLLLALSALGLVPQPRDAGAPAPAEPSADSIAAILGDRIARAGGVGLVAGRVGEDGPELHVAGRSSVTGAEPVGGHSVMEIGALSKVLTSVLLAEMVGRGEVALDDPVARHLPTGVRVPKHGGREITLRHLATHTSGLPRRPDNLRPADFADPYGGYTEEALHAFLRSHTLRRMPGERYEASTLGMGLLATALAHRAGLPYEALVTERVLEPLGMDDTRITLTPGMGRRLTEGHRWDLKPVPHWEMGVLAGAGGWLSTGYDMLRLLAALADPPASALGEALRLTLSTHTEIGEPGLRMGLGWHVVEHDGRPLAVHHGVTGGHYAFLGIDPVRGHGAFVLGNAAVSMEDIALHLLDPSLPVHHPPGVAAP